MLLIILWNISTGARSNPGSCIGIDDSSTYNLADLISEDDYTGERMLNPDEIQIKTMTDSQYVDLNDLANYLSNKKGEFSVIVKSPTNT